MRFLPVNLDVLLVELKDLDETLALFDALTAEPIAGVEEIVPAARTLMIQFRPSTIERQALVNRIAGQDISQRREGEHRRVEIPVHYNGEDLDEVATLLNISRAEVIQRHAAHDYSVAFCGFAPGFAYLTGGAGFQVPRRQNAAHSHPCRCGGVGGRLQRCLSQSQPWWVADHRRDAVADVGPEPRRACPAAPWL